MNRHGWRGTFAAEVVWPRTFPVKTGSPKMFYLFVLTQFLTQNRNPLLLELL